MSMKFYTYLHCRPDGTPFYVGKGQGKRSHVFTATRNQHHRNIVGKYGESNILVFVFPCESEQQALENEISTIKRLRSEGCVLCNQTDGGEGASGYVHTEAALMKMSAAKIGKKPGNFGKKFSAEICARMSAVRMGVKHSEEHREKNRITHLGKKCNIGRKATPETLARMSAAMTGKKMSAEACMKLSLRNIGNKNTLGRKHSPETIAKMSAAKMGNKANVGRVLSAESRAKISETRKRTNALRKANP